MKKIIYASIIILILLTTSVYASSEFDTESILVTQENSFGIRDFLKETNTYSKDFMEEIDVSELFNSAIKGEIDNFKLIKKIIKLITKQLINVTKTFVSIIIIVLIHSLLKALIEGLENSNISKNVFYVEYILIITIIMSNFSEILKIITLTIENLIGFSQSLIPLLVTLMVYTGNITTSTVIEPILLFLIEFIANCIKNLVLPIVSIITVLIVISKITDRVQINKLANFIQSSIVWFLGIILTIFIGVLSLEGNLTSSIDGITAKTTKAVVSTLIPVVR